MPIPTRADFEAWGVSRFGPYLRLVGKDATTVNGTNVDLNYPLADALRSLGLTVVTYSSVTDADLAQIPTDRLAQFHDFYELAALSSVWGCWTEVDFQAGMNRMAKDQIAKRLTERIAALEEKVRLPYGINIGPSVSGLMTAGQPIPNDPNQYWPGRWSPPFGTL